MKKNEANATNGIANFFSCAYRPGAMNSHTCDMTTGVARMRPASAAIFNCRKKYSGALV